MKVIPIARLSGSARWLEEDVSRCGEGTLYALLGQGRSSTLVRYRADDQRQLSLRELGQRLRELMPTEQPTKTTSADVIAVSPTTIHVILRGGEWGDNLVAVDKRSFEVLKTVKVLSSVVGGVAQSSGSLILYGGSPSPLDDGSPSAFIVRLSGDYRHRANLLGFGEKSGLPDSGGSRSAQVSKVVEHLNGLAILRSGRVLYTEDFEAFQPLCDPAIQVLDLFGGAKLMVVDGAGQFRRCRP